MHEPGATIAAKRGERGPEGRGEWASDGNAAVVVAKMGEPWAISIASDGREADVFRRRTAVRLSRGRGGATRRTGRALRWAGWPCGGARGSSSRAARGRVTAAARRPARRGNAGSARCWRDERALKMAIRHRNNSLFYKSQHSANVGDVSMTPIHTARPSWPGSPDGAAPSPGSLGTPTDSRRRLA